MAQDGGRAGAAALAGLMAPVAGDLRRGAVLSVLAGLLWPAQAGLVAAALGAALAGGGPVGPLTAALGFAALGAGRIGLQALAETRLQAAARRVTRDLRAEVVARESARAADTSFGGPGAVAALAGEKIDPLVPWLLRYAPARARAMVLPLAILALAFPLSWAAGAVLLVAGPLIPVFMALVGLAARDASARQMAEIGTLNDLLVDRLAALGDVRLLDAGGAVLAGFADRAGDLRARTMAVLRIAFLSSTVLELFAAIGVAMVAVFVGFSLLGQIGFGAWGGGLTPAEGIFLLLLAPDFFQPLRDLSAAWHDRAAAEAVAAEIAAWRAAPAPALPGTGGPAAPLPGPAALAFRGVVAPGGLALPDLEIAAGERVALMGPSGAGKTTALRLMAGLVLPQAGQVLAAGRPLTAACADGWRARLGFMPQAPHFLNASLGANVALGRPGDLAAALRAAAVDRVVAALPQGRHTRLGETGGGLSGGEARRLTLARAIHAAPDLILADEPTADLDAATAAAVIRGLLDQAARGATLIVATHDPALAARMDRVIRIGGQG